jgi:hypothetical protein
MVVLNTELWECVTCKSIIRRDQVEGICWLCGKRTCVYCHRVCERCKRIFCMNHVETKEIWRQGVMSRIMLCDNCNKVW